jgi:hypothetical protein
MSYHKIHRYPVLHPPEPRKLTLVREFLRRNFAPKIPGAEMIIDSGGAEMMAPDHRTTK